MSKDMCITCDDGILNIRVSAYYERRKAFYGRQ